MKACCSSGMFQIWAIDGQVGSWRSAASMVAGLWSQKPVSVGFFGATGGLETGAFLAVGLGTGVFVATALTIYSALLPPVGTICTGWGVVIVVVSVGAGASVLALDDEPVACPVACPPPVEDTPMALARSLPGITSVLVVVVPATWSPRSIA